jgi:hypothetical protein
LELDGFMPRAEHGTGFCFCARGRSWAGLVNPVSRNGI